MRRASIVLLGGAALILPILMSARVVAQDECTTEATPCPTEGYASQCTLDAAGNLRCLADELLQCADAQDGDRCQTFADAGGTCRVFRDGLVCVPDVLRAPCAEGEVGAACVVGGDGSGGAGGGPASAGSGGGDPAVGGGEPGATTGGGGVAGTVGPGFCYPRGGALECIPDPCADVALEAECTDVHGDDGWCRVLGTDPTPWCTAECVAEGGTCDAGGLLGRCFLSEAGSFVCEQDGTPCLEGESCSLGDGTMGVCRRTGGAGFLGCESPGGDGAGEDDESGSSGCCGGTPSSAGEEEARRGAPPLFLGLGLVGALGARRRRAREEKRG